MNAPISIYGSITTLTKNVPTYLSSDSLQNQSQSGILVDEILFSLSASGLNYLDVGGMVYVNLRLGREPLTSGFVPISMCAVGNDRNTELAGIYTWPLRPGLYLAPGECLSAQFLYTPPASVPPSLTSISDGFAWPTALTLGMSLSARETPEREMERAIPYVTVYVPTARDGNVGSFSDTSNESQLVNPIDGEFNIIRMLGRYYVGGMEPLGGLAQSGAALANEITIPLNQVTVKLSDWLGNQSIKVATPFYAAFPPNGRGWAVRTTLPKNGFFIVDLTGTLSGFTGIDCQPMIGLVGYRMVRV
jgi:hypothetical protein